MKTIGTRQELIALAEELGVRHDWHEPDEQGVDAKIYGDVFDNACFPSWEYAIDPRTPMKDKNTFIALFKDGQVVALVNLVILFAWATGYNDEGYSVDRPGTPPLTPRN